jgi:hypothetical protein
LLLGHDASLDKVRTAVKHASNLADRAVERFSRFLAREAGGGVGCEYASAKRRGRREYARLFTVLITGIGGE